MTAQRPKPIPQWTPETQPFWEACKRHELMIQRCQDCSRFYFYPRPYCPHCLSDRTEWTRVSGRGTLHTYVINHRPAPGFEAEAPYVIAIVKLAEGPHLMSNVVGVEPKPENLPVGLELEVVFDDVNDQVAIPKFRPARS
ncbi:MAG TPA: Zn-ribbon domain-containing OB-fold protein [Dehalococcoidia bacterium]|nr:Zn-ribbon domain-containing OB-fold protein [Dehalococcoidia bacterium]